MVCQQIQSGPLNSYISDNVLNTFDTQKLTSFLYSTAEEGLCVWAKIFIFVSFSSLHVLATLTRGPDDALVSLR